MGFSKIAEKIKDYGTLVMFSHTIFSLSFALIAMLLAAEGLPNPWTVFWILVAFMGARTGANAINRVIDAEIDKKNPRTAHRQIPKGLMNSKEVVLFTAACFALMVLGAAMLNPLCLMLSPVALFFLSIYSYTKRFTWACHLVLGITSAMAPVGAWLAVRGEISLVPLVIGAANTLWVAGFDIIYGAQDYAFDTANGINSIPARFGVKNGLSIAKGFHMVTLLLLILLGFLAEGLGILYFIGLLIIGVLFIIEHRMVSPENLTNVKLASYSINQLISVTFLVFGILATITPY